MARFQPAVGRQRPSSERAISRGGFPRNVWILGWVSLLNDSATEMSYWLLPQFLVSVLRASPMAFGFIEGAAETAASLSRLVSGFLSDRLGRRKQLIATGYTVANITKPFLGLTQSWTQVFWIRFADRAAKGFRGAPRDALIADSVSAEERGAAFGFRQAMDSAGAILGPLGAAVLLPLLCRQHPSSVLAGRHSRIDLYFAGMVQDSGNSSASEDHRAALRQAAHYGLRCCDRSRYRCCFFLSLSSPWVTRPIYSWCSALRIWACVRRLLQLSD